MIRSENMFKIFSRDRLSIFHHSQENLFFLLEKIVNIASVKTELGDNESVVKILKDLESVFRDFLALRKTNPEKFEQLLFDRDFYDQYVKPNEQKATLTGDSPKDTKTAEQLQYEASSLLFWAPERQLSGLQQFLRSFQKIWSRAFRSGNAEIGKYVVYHLIWLLEELLKDTANKLFVDQLLGLLYDIAAEGIREGNELDASIFYASIQWYPHTVFNTERNGFELSYLKDCDRIFLWSQKLIISENRGRLFSNLLSSLVSGINILSYDSGLIWEYESKVSENVSEQLGSEIQSRVDELARLNEGLDSEDDTLQWLQKFMDLKNKIHPAFPDYAKLLEIEQRIEAYAITQYKFNNLLRIVVAIGAYCLFKKRYAFIRNLWEYKQPPDSDAHWIGHDIVPTTPQEVLSLYVRGWRWFRDMLSFWDGHHGSDLYLRKYFILLLMRAVSKTEGKTGGMDILTDRFDVFQLRDIENKCDNFIEGFRTIMGEKKLLDELGFSGVEQKKIEDKMEPFLNSVKEAAKTKLKSMEEKLPISSEKIRSFKQQFIDSFYNNARIRTIFQLSDAIIAKSTETYAGELGRFGVNTLYDKAAFFDEWYVQYMDTGSQWGRNMATAEDTDLLGRIAISCISVNLSSTEMDAMLENIAVPSNPLIISDDVYLNGHLSRDSNFEPEWRSNREEKKIKGLKGWYMHGGVAIPVLMVFPLRHTKRFFILNSSKLGKLIQYSPLQETEASDLQDDIFFFNIRALSDEPDLVEEYLKSSPKWLEEQGTIDKQKEYLKKRVLVQVFERYDYVPDDFEGYLIRFA